MAFWGIELKPGRPFTHSSVPEKRRLHISQATLGIGSATGKLVVQCNVGNRSPVFLCSLFPEKLESCQLNLEFEEADDVVLSVLGPRSVHLTGYYTLGCRQFNLNDESETYGEDIANTSERSNHSNEEYDDSFINDGDPEVFSASHVSSSEAIEEQTKHKEHKNSHRRLRKKYLVESDEDNNSEEKLIPSDAVLDSEDDDKLPISSLGSNKRTSKITQSKAEADISKKTCGDGESVTVPERKDDTCLDGDPESRAELPHASLPSSEVDHAQPKKSKGLRKKEKGRLDSDCHDNVVRQNHIQSKMVKAGDGSVDRPVKNDKINGQGNDEGTELLPDSRLPTMEMDLGNGAKLKRKRKSSEIEGTSNAFKENEAQSGNINPSLIDKQNQTAGIDIERVADKNQSERKMKKKKKKSKKSYDHGNDLRMEILPSLVDKNGCLVDGGVSNTQDKSSKLRTLSGGLVIEEVKVGKRDGKIAASGKKISVHYTGKLKDGQIFESNVEGKPLKFRLGGGEVIEGFDIGLEGMHVGDKRRLEIPPVMGYGSEGDGVNVPPDAWLEYEVELVRVHH